VQQARSDGEVGDLRDNADHAGAVKEIEVAARTAVCEGQPARGLVSADARRQTAAG
jgi:hypothetical protein